MPPPNLQMTKKLLSILPLMLCFVHIGAPAEVFFTPYSKKQECANEIIIQGEITARTTTLIKNMIEKNFNSSQCSDFSYRLAFLDSSGGSVDDAMRIGYMLRDNEFEVRVKKFDKCYSSCVLILAAGVRRMPFGQIGIHRPYLEYLGTDKTIDEIKEVRSQLNARIEKYLEAMEVSTKLLDDMISIEPERLKILDMSELENYRLTGQPISIDERNTAAMAYMFGLKSSEFRVKSLSANKICEAKYPFFEDSRLNEIAELRYVCWIAAILGVAESIAKNKEALVKSSCKNFPSFPISKRQKFLDCKRKLYLNE
jgi:hypothetical protein